MLKYCVVCEHFDTREKMLAGVFNCHVIKLTISWAGPTAAECLATAADEFAASISLSESARKQVFQLSWFDNSVGLAELMPHATTIGGGRRASDRPSIVENKKYPRNNKCGKNSFVFSVPADTSLTLPWETADQR